MPGEYPSPLFEPDLVSSELAPRKRAINHISLKETKTMKKLTTNKRSSFAATLTIVGIIGATIGCGGAGNTSSGPSPTPTPSASPTSGASRYAGRYTGTFVDATNSIDGDITFNVGSDGAVTGSGKDAKTGQLDPFVGSIDDSGNLMVTVTLDTTPYTVKGKMSFGTGAQLSGNLNEFYGATDVGAVAVNLVRS
jgi:hypothetical protein